MKTLKSQHLNSKLSHKAETESLIDTIIRASVAGSPQTQTTDQAMRKENGIELSNWEKKKRKHVVRWSKELPLIETKEDENPKSEPEPPGSTSKQGPTEQVANQGMVGTAKQVRSIVKIFGACCKNHKEMRGAQLHQRSGQWDDFFL